MAADETIYFIIHGENISDSNMIIPDRPRTKYRPVQNIFPVSRKLPSPFRLPIMICAPMLNPNPIMNSTI